MVCGRKAKLMFLSFSHVSCDTHSTSLKPGSWAVFCAPPLGSELFPPSRSPVIAVPTEKQASPAHLLMPWPSNLDIPHRMMTAALVICHVFCVHVSRNARSRPECEKPVRNARSRPECEKPFGLCSPLGSSTTVDDCVELGVAKQLIRSRNVIPCRQFICKLEGGPRRMSQSLPLINAGLVWQQ